MSLVICPYLSIILTRKNREVFNTEVVLRYHLESNVHFGVEKTCPKCFKGFPGVDSEWVEDMRFKKSHCTKPPIVRLASHLTSNSEDCAIKRTKRFGHVFHLLTGGYLGVVYDDHMRVSFKVVEEPSPELPLGDDYDDLDRGFRNW